MSYKIEVTVDSIESALNAENGGADRIELCANLPEGGTTPSIGLIEKVKEVLSIPVYVIIRPRGGDFLYTDDEFNAMKKDILQAKKVGADGVVFGILDAEGQIDMLRNKELLKLAEPLETSFHRAFDMSKDPYKALEDIIDLGFDCILTSGQKNVATDGIELIRKLIDSAENRITIMPGSGINEDNILDIQQFTGATEFHVSLREPVQSKMIYQQQNISMGKSGADEFERMVTSADRVRGIKRILHEK